MTKAETVSLTEARKDIQYMQDDLRNLNETIKNLPEELVKKLDERYAKKQEVKQIQETIAPLTTFRKRLWDMVVYAAFTSAFLAVIYKVVSSNITK